MNQTILLSENVVVIKNGPLINNTYIIHENNNAIIIDPSFAEKEIKNFIDRNHIKDYIILITHHHFDHFGCTQKLISDAKNIYIGKQEKEYVNSKYSNYLDDALEDDEFIEKIIWLTNDNIVDFNGIQIKCLNTPAHTIGSYTYQYKNYFFTGDFFFAKNIGFFDMTNEGDNHFKKSIKKMLNYFNDETTICPGHNEIDLWINVKKNNEELIEYSGMEL